MDIVIAGANGAVGTALICYLGAGTPLGAVRLRALVRSSARVQVAARARCRDHRR